MSRPRTPQQFILDEETELEDIKDQRHSLSSQESATESLLQNSHSYPPPSERLSEKPPESHDDQQPSASHYTISIPTRSQVDRARSHPGKRNRHPKLIIVGLLSLFGFAYFSTQILAMFTRFNGQPKIQVVLMISDGMGPASETFARSYLKFLHDTNSTSSSTISRSMLNESVWAGLEKEVSNQNEGGTPLDSILVGSSRTRSSNSLITDSAAGATAFSCLLKTYNGGIGVTPAKTPCGTILESAHHQGFTTGIVTTSRITHATPASFYSHVVDRDLESDIAEFLIGKRTGFNQGRTVDLAFGGGKCFFVGNQTQPSCRNDTKNLLEGINDEFRIVEGMKGLREWKDEELEQSARNGKKSVLGLFANDHMDYEIDRQRTEHLVDEQPSLKEMASHALKWLKRRSSKGKGFFLVIEGARIDMAAHNNDPIGHLSDILAYYETVQYVKQWVDDENDLEGIPTVLVSVSDHETGGLTLGRQLSEVYPEYLWYPEVLHNATHSTAYLGKEVADRYPVTTRDWVRTEIYEKGLGIVDVEKWELDELWQERSDAYKANRVLADAISRRAQIGWSTAGHSGVDVNLYAYGHNATGLKGCVENTQVGEFIAHTMGLNLDVVTLELNKNLKSWFSPDAGQSPNITSNLKHYEGEF